MPEKIDNEKVKELRLSEKELQEVLTYLGDIPKKYADPLYNSLVKQFQEQNKEETT
ncbi:MAG: hypothetical protein WBA93_23580 [Microcoleaceae cyanobacterium]